MIRPPRLRLCDTEDQNLSFHFLLHDNDHAMLAAQDWNVVAKGMTDVLEKEAKERALNRDAIERLRRHDMFENDAGKRGTIYTARGAAAR